MNLLESYIAVLSGSICGDRKIGTVKEAENYIETKNDTANGKFGFW
jgi:hypothetical protein